MPVPISLTPAYRAFTFSAPASISAGFTVAFGSPCRGVVVAVLLAPLDGNAITGSAALLSMTIANVASAQVSCAPVAAGVASGGREILGATARVAETDCVKLTLPGATLSNASLGVLTVVIRLL